MVCSLFLSSAFLFLSLPPPLPLSSLPHVVLTVVTCLFPSIRPGWGRFGAGWPGGTGARGALQDGGPRGQRTGVHPFGDEERRLQVRGWLNAFPRHKVHTHKRGQQPGSRPVARTTSPLGVTNAPNNLTKPTEIDWRVLQLIASCATMFRPHPADSAGNQIKAGTRRTSARSTSPHRTSASRGRHGQAAATAAAVAAAPGHKHPRAAQASKTRTCGLGHLSETPCSRALPEIVRTLPAAEGER